MGCLILPFQGWFPLYDTLRGARGDLSLGVKLQFIGNENPFRESSAGVRFFSLSALNPDVSSSGSSLDLESCLWIVCRTESFGMQTSG
jgi:hypothetical protein